MREKINTGQAEQYPGIRLSKYTKLNLIVILVILLVLLVVFFWYERNLDKIDEEMTKQSLGWNDRNGRSDSHIRTP